CILVPKACYQCTGWVEAALPSSGCPAKELFPGPALMGSPEDQLLSELPPIDAHPHEHASQDVLQTHPGPACRRTRCKAALNSLRPIGNIPRPARRPRLLRLGLSTACRTCIPA